MELYFCFIYCSFPVFEKDRAVYLQFTFSTQIGFCYARDSFLPNLVELEFGFAFPVCQDKSTQTRLFTLWNRGDELVRDDDTV